MLSALRRLVLASGRSAPAAGRGPALTTSAAEANHLDAPVVPTRSGPAEAGPGMAAAPAGQEAIYLVDASTRTYWRRGAPRSETLVEDVAGAPRDSVGRRVAGLLSSRDARVGSRADADLGRVAGAADPAFLELLMVELLRAASFERAFSLLAPDCQRRWMSATRFAVEHGELPSILAGVEVLDSRRLHCWSDPDWERAHWDVAELDVEYRLLGGGASRSLRRSVHMVRFDGRWRYLLYPQRVQACAAG